MFHVPVGSLVVPTSLPDLHRAVALAGTSPVIATDTPLLAARAKTLETTVVFGPKDDVVRAISAWAPRPVVIYGRNVVDVPDCMVTLTIASDDPVVFLSRTGVSHGDVYVIGDVHNCHRTLRAMLATMGITPGKPTSSDPLLVFVGDLVDKGGSQPPDVLETLRLAAQLTHHGQAVCVRGNHEHMLLRRLRGVSPVTENSKQSVAAVRGAPDADVLTRFMRSMPLMYDLPSVSEGERTEKVTVAHAMGTTQAYSSGVRAQRIAEQSCLFGRPTTSPLSGIVIHGHWEVDHATCTREGRSLRVNVDTGACEGNALSAYTPVSIPEPGVVPAIVVSTLPADMPPG